jgi:hypothetical protein
MAARQQLDTMRQQLPSGGGGGEQVPDRPGIYL